MSYFEAHSVGIHRELHHLYISTVKTSSILDAQTCSNQYALNPPNSYLIHILNYRHEAISIGLWTRDRELFGLNFGSNTSCTESFRVISQAFQVNVRILIPLGHNRFLSHPLTLIIHRSTMDTTIHTIATWKQWMLSAVQLL